MKSFTDYEALERVISRISAAAPPDDQVKVLSDLLVAQLDFTFRNASVYARTVLRHRRADSAACIGINASKLTGSWFSITQSGMIGGYMDSTTYKWDFHPDLTFEYRKESLRGYSSAFSSGFSSSSSDDNAGQWAPSDASGNEFEVVTIDRIRVPRTLSVRWIDQAMALPRSCRIDGRDFARE